MNSQDLHNDLLRLRDSCKKIRDEAIAERDNSYNERKMHLYTELCQKVVDYDKFQGNISYLLDKYFKQEK